MEETGPSKILSLEVWLMMMMNLKASSTKTSSSMINTKISRLWMEMNNSTKMIKLSTNKSCKLSKKATPLTSTENNK